jgi:hypothetical protein
MKGGEGVKRWNEMTPSSQRSMKMMATGKAKTHFVWRTNRTALMVAKSFLNTYVPGRGLFFNHSVQFVCLSCLEALPLLCVVFLVISCRYDTPVDTKLWRPRTREKRIRAGIIIIIVTHQMYRSSHDCQWSRCGPRCRRR